MVTQAQLQDARLECDALQIKLATVQQRVQELEGML